MKSRAGSFTKVLVVLMGLVALALSGPRVSTEYSPRIIQLSDDLEVYLADAESRFQDLRPGTEKAIVWAHEDRRPTDISIVYLHGFSASRRDVAPLVDRIANELGANIYYGRLTGHGRSGEAMAEATMQAWLDDALEAWAIGQAIGRQVVLIGTSTGGTLAAWLSMQKDIPAPLATVLISPNFGARRWESNMLTWPWAKYFVPLIQGDTHAWAPRNEAQGRYWTTSYPTAALFPMGALVSVVRKADPATVRAPVLMFYSENDGIVNSAGSRRFFDRLVVDPSQAILVEDSEDPDQHVLAGDILSPRTTGFVADRIIEFVHQLTAPDVAVAPAR